MPTRHQYVLAPSFVLLAWLTCIAAVSPAAAQTSAAPTEKLDPVLQARSSQVSGRSRVIVEYSGIEDVRAITRLNGRLERPLGRLRAHVANVDNTALAALAADPRVARVMADRPAFATLARAGLATGATVARETFGVTGRNVGVALIDSGVESWRSQFACGGDSGRVAHFKDFTREPGDPAADVATDEYGHGTHVSGIIAGCDANGGARQGLAPGANLIGLKVLDAHGQGYVSDIIEAIDYAIAIKDLYNIRVINLSVAAGVFESPWRDPLTLAAKRADDAGILVVAAAGNLGENEEGQPQFGGITAPGNARWVLTVGASSHNGTAGRSDDMVAGFSSRGPTFISFDAKPDLVAPGYGIESVAAQNSTLAAQFSAYLVGDANSGGAKPFLSLSGTSMAAPMVTAAAALLLEANPALTPNAIRAILQYTAQPLPGASPLSQGTGLLNIPGALRLATFFKEPAPTLDTIDVIAGEAVPWSRQIIWGNYRISGGVPLPDANAWTIGLTWGSMQVGHGINSRISWGARVADDDTLALELEGDALVLATAGRRNIVWATADRRNIVWATDGRRNIVWATGDRRNIVWATADRRNIVWATGDRRNIVWATGDRRNIVWATADRRNIVWATALGENVVWGDDCGGSDCEREIWGDIAGDGQVWGTAAATDNVLWASSARRNIVWATDYRRNIVWATGDRRNIVWATGDRRNIVWATGMRRNIVWATSAGPAVLWTDSQ